MSLLPYAPSSTRAPYDASCLEIAFVPCLMERHELLEELGKFYHKHPEIRPHLDKTSQAWPGMADVTHDF